MYLYDFNCNPCEDIMNEGLIVDSSGRFVQMLEPSERLPLPFPIGSVGSLLYPSSGGSGFVVEVLDNQGDNSRPIAIVLTAAHIFYNPQTVKRNKYPWLFTFELHPHENYNDALKYTHCKPKDFENEFKHLSKNFEAYLAEPIDKGIDWKESPEKDPVSSNYIVRSNDFILFKVYDKSPFPIPISKSRSNRTKFRKMKLLLDMPENLVFTLRKSEYQIEEEKIPDHLTECYLFGRPGTISDDRFLHYVPEAKTNSPDDAIISICGGEKLVASRGNIIHAGELISASTSSYFGMSGGPLCIIKNNEWHAVGLLISSPPTRLHYAFYMILANLTYSFMDMDQLFQLISNRLEDHPDWIHELERLVFLKDKYLGIVSWFYHFPL